MKNTEAAFHWIINILESHGIAYKTKLAREVDLEDLRQLQDAKKL